MSSEMSNEVPKDMVHPVRSNINVDDMGIKSVLSNQDIVISVDHEVTKDEAMIMALGYKQEFKREFNLWSIFSVSFSTLGLLPSIAATFSYEQLVIGVSPVPWLIGVLFISSVSFSLAETASAFPTSAGTPYAVSQLAPKKIAPLMTWLCAYSNWFCQITSFPSVDYSCACLILALKSFNSTSGYVPTNGHIYGVATALQALDVLISVLRTKWVARFNSLGTVINMVCLIIVFIVLLAGNTRTERHHDISKFNSNSEAWSLYNQTEFPQGLAFLMSFLGVIWAMSGYDSPFHLSEESSNAATAAPTAIVLTATCGGIIGFFFIIAIAYTIVDINQVAADPQGLGQPFITYMVQVLDRKLVNLSASLTVISSFFMGQSCMLAASRVTYAYSRDGLFPLSKYWKIVDKRTQTPINAVLINFVLGQLLLLLVFAGDTAIGAIFSVGGIAGFISFTLPTFFKITYARKTFKPGPWNLGIFSQPIGYVSVAFIIVMIPILCFPDVKGKDLTPDEMNWTSLVYFGPLLLVSVWYLVDAHKWYIGPKSNLDDTQLGYSNSNVEEIPSEESANVHEKV